MKQRSIFVLLLVALYCAWAVSPVQAHAVFVRSNPPPNAVLTQPPPQVDIYFSEGLQDGLSSVAVYDSAGKQVDIGDVRVDYADPTHITVSLHRLNDGVYTVSWKAISVTDGHFTTGSFPFAVGEINRAAITAAQQSSSSTLPISALVAKWLLLAALAVLVGEIPFKLLIWNLALKPDQNALTPEIIEPPFWRKISTFAWIAFLVGLSLSLLSQAGQATGNELAWPWSSETSLVLIGSRLGLVWLLRLALTILGIWLLFSRATPRWKLLLDLMVRITLLLTISLISHAANEARPFLPILADWLHLMGMCLWFGGLVYLLSGLYQLKRLDGALRTRLIAISMARFSVMALTSVGVIGVTGFYAATLRVGSLEALDNTIYGHVMYFKQGFVVALLMLAAVNLLFLTPRLRSDWQAGLSNLPFAGYFEKMVRGEIILACFLLLTVSLLTYLPPAKVTPPTSELNGDALVDDLQMDVNIAPGMVGLNTFTLKLASNGQPVPSVKAALLRFTPDNGLAPSEVQLIGQGDGSYVTKGSYLSQAANWQVQAVVRRADKFDAYANFNFTVKLPGANTEDADVSRFSAWFIILNAVLFGVFMVFTPQKPILRFGAGLAPALVLVTCAVFILLFPSATHIQNPIPPNPESIAAGQELFSNYCVPCHGVFGKGDGPLGLTLNPRPADLSYHAISGIHTDAQLFEWITNGFPGSRMPAFKERFSDTDRWNLVNYIRTLAPK